MNQSVLPGFEFLLMVTKEIMQEYPKAQTVGELDEMLLKVCHEANNESISDSEFRGMIYDLMLRKVELMEDRMPKVQAYLKISHSLSIERTYPTIPFFLFTIKRLKAPTSVMDAGGFLLAHLHILSFDDFTGRHGSKGLSGPCGGHNRKQRAGLGQFIGTQHIFLQTGSGSGYEARNLGQIKMIAPAQARARHRTGAASSRFPSPACSG